MSRPVTRSTDWYQALCGWLRGRSILRRDGDQGPPETVAVEFLEQRQLLTNILGTNATPEQLAANVSDLSWVDTDQALATAVQSDGKIVLVGSAEITADGDTDFAVTRLNADGTLDLTFGTGGKKTIAFDLGGVNCDVATCVAIQSDGKIVIGGYAQRTISGNFDFALVRLNTDGSLDNSFSTDGKATVSFDYGGTGDDRASGIAIQPDGRIVIVGYAKVANDGRSDFAMARLTTTGDLDTTFSVDGLKRVDFNGGDDKAKAVTIQSNGRIVIVGSGQSSNAGYDFAIARITPTGSMDRSFTSDGRKVISFNRGGNMNDQASAVAIQTDGSLVIAGTSTSSAGDGDFAVARVKSNGSMDYTFGMKGRKAFGIDLGAGNEDQLKSMALQSDGKIVVGGFAQLTAEGDFDFAVARLNVDGSLDPTFSADGKKNIAFDVGGTKTDLAHSVVIQSDGKILLAGSAMVTNPANSDFAIARLNSDGQLDDSFGTNGIKTVLFDLT